MKDPLFTHIIVRINDDDTLGVDHVAGVVTSVLGVQSAIPAFEDGFGRLVTDPTNHPLKESR